MAARAGRAESAETGGPGFAWGCAAVLDAPPTPVWEAVRRIGGERGWYAGNALWRLRGGLDRLLGGPGMRGRSDPAGLCAGDVVDFWRVAELRPERLLLLRAEMRAPGVATLEFRLEPRGAGTELALLARFLPRGLWGRAYWYALLPAHGPLFRAMLRGLAKAAGARALSGPSPLDTWPEAG